MDESRIVSIAVDDEPAALRIIEKFAEKLPGLGLAKTFRNPLEAISYLNRNPVQLIFLDINMPEMSGLDFIKSLTNPPLIILSTAYSEFALESYEYNVLDYLLKPIAFPRFVKAVNKASTLIYPASQETIKQTSLTLKDSGNTYQIHPEEILYLESLGNYVKVYTESDTIVIKSGLQQFLEENPKINLQRVHKSFAVNLSRIKKMSYSYLSLEKKDIPIGRKYREEIRKAFEIRT